MGGSPLEYFKSVPYRSWMGHTIDILFFAHERVPTHWTTKDNEWCMREKEQEMLSSLQDLNWPPRSDFLLRRGRIDFFGIVKNPEQFVNSCSSLFLHLQTWNDRKGKKKYIFSRFARTRNWIGRQLTSDEDWVIERCVLPIINLRYINSVIVCAAIYQRSPFHNRDEETPLCVMGQRTVNKCRIITNKFWTPYHSFSIAQLFTRRFNGIEGLTCKWKRIDWEHDKNDCWE